MERSVKSETVASTTDPSEVDWAEESSNWIVPPRSIPEKDNNYTVTIVGHLLDSLSKVTLEVESMQQAIKQLTTADMTQDQEVLIETLKTELNNLKEQGGARNSSGMGSKTTCWRCGEDGHISTTCTKQTVCSYCSTKDHVKSTCRLLKKEERRHARFKRQQMGERIWEDESSDLIVPTSTCTVLGNDTDSNYTVTIEHLIDSLNKVTLEVESMQQVIKQLTKSENAPEGDLAITYENKGQPWPRSVKTTGMKAVVTEADNVKTRSSVEEKEFNIAAALTNKRYSTQRAYRSKVYYRCHQCKRRDCLADNCGEPRRCFKCSSTDHVMKDCSRNSHGQPLKKITIIGGQN